MIEYEINRFHLLLFVELIEIGKRPKHTAIRDDRGILSNRLENRKIYLDFMRESSIMN